MEKIMLSKSDNKTLIFVIIGIVYAFAMMYGYSLIEYISGTTAYKLNSCICTIFMLAAAILNSVFPLSKKPFPKKILNFVCGIVIVAIVSFTFALVIFFLTPMNFGD